MPKFLATHVGSPPRNPAVVDFLVVRERGENPDPTPSDACMTATASETLRHQVEAMRAEHRAIVAAGHVLQLDGIDPIRIRVHIC